MTFAYHPNFNGGSYGEREIPYKSKIIVESDTGFVKAYDYSKEYGCYCLWMFGDYMTIEEAKARIDKEVAC